MSKDKLKYKTVITTHANADFDAVASMLAAQKLYPGSVMVFPSSNEKNLRNFFIQSVEYLFNMLDIRDIDFGEIEKLVIVDTRQINRIGNFASILNRPGLKIDIYDHHPDREDDIKGDYEVIMPTGSAVAILTGIIKEKKVEVSPDEATIMCLGIYEDTGSFSYSSTTEKDFLAAGFLVSRGADLNVVSNLLAREINPEQVGLLNDLIRGAAHYNINGVNITISTVISDHYISDFAFVVHKMIRMEKMDAIIALAQMDNKIYIVARSRIPEVDMGIILADFGGGGHSFAAAASVKGKTLVQVEQEVLDTINRHVSANRLARDFMSSPPITVKNDLSCKETHNLFTRYDVNALLVVETGSASENSRLVGYISRQVVEKALYHKLGKFPVEEYATTEIETVGPDAKLGEIQDKIIAHKQRILPVMENDKIIGVISRTDLLDILVSQSQERVEILTDTILKSVNPRFRNVYSLMKERIPDRIITMLITIGIEAKNTGCQAYVVGGFVRDLLLFRPNEDIDIVIEGDGIAFAKKFAKKNKGRIYAYEKFGTAVITFPDGFKIDIASARMEYYKFPAALPTVEMSSVKLDLFRRDFTINTLAIQLTEGKIGTLIDFFSGQRDIKSKAIRVLHNLSFVEDPTRAFRAIRFEQRFGFPIGKLTSGLIKSSVRMGIVAKLSGRRVFSEFRQILEEDNPVPAIKRLADYNLLKVIHPSLRLTKKLIDLLSSIRNVISWFELLFLEESYMKWSVYFLAIISSTKKEGSEKICRRFEFLPEHEKMFTRDRFEANKTLAWLERSLPVKNSLLYRNLAIYKTELILYMMAAAKRKNTKKSISKYFTDFRYMTISVTGKDLIEMGFTPGPLFREIFQALFDAKLNGIVKTKKDEFEFARNYV